MFNPGFIYWISIAFLIMLIDPDTLVKIMAVLWVLFVAYWLIVRVLFRRAWNKGKVKVDFGCEHRAHSIHCDALDSVLQTCNCEPKHPTDCGHCK